MLISGNKWGPSSIPTCKICGSFETVNADCDVVCVKCGYVYDHSLAYEDSPSPSKSHIFLPDEKNIGSKNIVPSGKSLPKLGKTQKNILASRSNPKRDDFHKTCVVLGMKPDVIRLCFFWYDTLHKIRTDNKQNLARFNSLFDIITMYGPRVNSKFYAKMIKSKLWNTEHDCVQWLKEFTPDGLDTFDTPHIKKPKRLTTANVAFFSIYHVACESRLGFSPEKITESISNHMNIARELKPDSAMAACRTALILYSDIPLDVSTPVVQNRIDIVAQQLKQNIRAQRGFYGVMDKTDNNANPNQVASILEVIS
jgi:hypothetical protein